jgi:hypothetical protein
MNESSKELTSNTEIYQTSNEITEDPSATTTQSYFNETIYNNNSYSSEELTLVTLSGYETTTPGFITSAYLSSLTADTSISMPVSSTPSSSGLLCSIDEVLQCFSYYC